MTRSIGTAALALLLIALMFVFDQRVKVNAEVTPVEEQGNAPLIIRFPEGLLIIQIQFVPNEALKEEEEKPELDSAGNTTSEVSSVQTIGSLPTLGK